MAESESDAAPIENEGQVIEDAITANLAASSIGALSQRIEGVAQIIVDHPDRPKLTNLFNRDEPRLHARLAYSQQLKLAVRNSDRDGFKFPDMEEHLLTPDYNLRTSVKQQTRKILESITKIFERGGESPRRGGFFRRG